MKPFKILVSIPAHLRVKLDIQRRKGTTASGLIRHLLEQHFNRGRRNPAA